VGAGAAFMGLLLTPLAHADDGGTELAESWLETQFTLENLYIPYDPDVIPFGLPGAGAETAYGALSNLGQDGVTEFADLYGEEIQSFSDIFGDITSVGNLIEGGINDVGSLAHIAGAADASTILSAIEAQNAELTDQIASVNDLPRATAIHENMVTGDLVGFQGAINNAVDDLPTITSQDETNPALIFDLSAVLSSEDNMSPFLTNLSTEVEHESSQGIVSANAYIYDFINETYNYMQATVNDFNLLGL
jgi:hypothetical protein